MNNLTNTLISLIGGICLAICIYGISLSIFPSLRLTDVEKERIELSYEYEMIISQFEVYKLMSDRIYDTIVDPDGDTFSETDLGSMYLESRCTVEDMLKELENGTGNKTESNSQTKKEPKG